MKSRPLSSEELNDRRLLLYLEGSLEDPELARMESDLAKDPTLASRLEKIRQICDHSNHQSELRLSDAEADELINIITNQPSQRSWRRPKVLGFAGASCAAILLFLTLTPRNTAPPPAELQWESAELWTLSRDVSVAGMQLADETWRPVSGQAAAVLENTDRSLLHLRLRMARLEASLEPHFERTVP